MKLDRYAKALTGALVGFVTTYFALKGGGVTADEWWNIIVATLAGGGFVYVVPNAKDNTAP